MRPLPLSLYRLATRLAEPLAPAVLEARGRRGKEDPRRLGERLGRASRDRPEGLLAWLHGVSVGEALSLLPLADLIGRRRPDVFLLVTSGTVAAASVLVERRPGLAHQYAPLDLPGVARRFIRHWRPDLAVFAESELWPNLLVELRAQGVRSALVSGQLSAASERRWRRAPGSLEFLLGGFAVILARDEIQAERIGAFRPARGVADLKLAAPPLDADEAALAALRDQLTDRPLALAASTHPGEEGIVLEAFAGLRRAAPEAMLAIAPRHPTRASEVTRLVERLGLGHGLRSRGAAPAPGKVLVIDVLGELGLWYRAARLAIVGGSLVPGVGGHNPLEPARLACPLVAGRHVEKWPIYDALVGSGGARLVAGAEDLADAMAAAILDRASAARGAAAAAALVADRERDTLAALEEVVRLLPP